MNIGLLLAVSAVIISATALVLNARPPRPVFTGAHVDSVDDSFVEPDTELLDRVSHELRTPLTSIHGALGLVTNGSTGPVSPEAQELLCIAAENSQRMLRLVNELLEYRRNGANPLLLDVRQTDTVCVVDEAIRSIRPLSEEKEVRVSSSVERVEVRIDHGRSVQVLVNILHNALRASPRGGTITVTGSFGQAGYELMVDDEGPGVPVADRARIFDPYATLRSTGQETPGTGLGLAIAEQIASAHGGQILVETAPTGGARFVFVLPTSVLVDVISTAG